MTYHKAAQFTPTVYFENDCPSYDCRMLPKGKMTARYSKQTPAPVMNTPGSLDFKLIFGRLSGAKITLESFTNTDNSMNIRQNLKSFLGVSTYCAEKKSCLMKKQSQRIPGECLFKTVLTTRGP